MMTIATQDKSAVLSVPQVDAHSAAVFRQAYTESPKENSRDHSKEAYSYEADVLLRLKANIAQLEDLHGRLKYMMGEIGYLLKKS